jgi:glycosyltransferase involved in cell wall biosynthesis
MLKEAILFSKLGHEVTVIWCPISIWADDFDKELFNKYSSINWVQAGWHLKRHKFCYLLSRIRKKSWYFIYKIFGNRFDSGIKSMVLFSQELSKMALKHKADLYIGHNLGAIASIVKAAHKFKAETIFDFEDFYRGEYDEDSIDAHMVRDIEIKYICKVNIFIAASPEIANAYKRIFPEINIQTILNVFPIAYAHSTPLTLPPSPLKLFWFSQFIGKNRGLETVIRAIGRLKNYDITLTLLGNVTIELKEYFIKILNESNVNQNKIFFLNPVRESQLAQIASSHHIGIASEVGNNLNRQYCLTNKIFIYMLAGNALVCSDTYAQKKFIDENKGIGFVYAQDNHYELSEIFKNYISDNDLLNKHQNNSISASYKQYNWDLEKYKYLSILENIK